ncbi:NACHT domain-containing protein [Actinomadura geliboluensis]|uniref:NACHT domain-containing protein n=1 Tax=Actinomadura geliboluensis TaxID=882440 RepID=UPI00371C57B0
MSDSAEPVSGRAALAAQLGLLQAGLRRIGKTQKAAVEEANRRRRRAAGRPQDRPWPRKDGGVDLSLQAVNDWFPKQKGSKEPSVPADFEDLWSLVAVMLEWTRQLTDKRSESRLRYAWNRLYEDAQRGTGPGEEVRAYLKAVRKAADQHPHPGIPGQTAPPLAEVYVRQRSTPAARHGLHAEVEPAEAVFRKADRVCVLIGGPGCGKSTLLRTWLSEAASEWLDGTGSVGKTGAAVPVWVSAHFLARDQRPVPDALAAATRNLSRYGRHPELAPARFLARPCPGAHWQLLVDGLDELPNAAERRAVLEKLANAVAEDPPLYRCVVATRPLAGNELDVLDRLLDRRAPHYDLQPFTPGDLHTYTQKYFGTRWRQEEATHRAQYFTGALHSASLAELARTPLVSFMLCQLYLAEPERPLPKGRTAVYEAFTDLMYENNHSKHVADSHEEAITNLVEGLQSPQARQEADEAARQAHEQLPELIDYLAHRWLTGHQAPAAATLASHKTLRRPGKVRPELWDAFLEDLLRHTGLLVQHPDGLSFPHQTLLEYHAARHATRNKQARRHTLRRLFGLSRFLPVWLQRLQARLWPDWLDWDFLLNLGEFLPWLKRLLVRPPQPGRPDQEPSYIGFLLDRLTSRDDRIGKKAEACLKAPKGIHFLVDQVRLRTNLPAESTALQLARYYASYPRTDDPSRRRELAETLAMVDQGWGVRLLESRANDPTLDEYSRYLRTKRKMEVERAARLLETRANEPIFTDPTLSFADRLAAAEALTKVDLERAVRLLEALAIDLSFDVGNRAAAANALEKVDPLQGRQLGADAMLEMAGGFY